MGNEQDTGKDIMIREMSYRDGILQMEAEHPEFVHMGKIFVEGLKKFGGENYLSVGFRYKDGEEYEVVVRYAKGKTPAALNIELKEEIKRLEEKNLLLEERIYALQDRIDSNN